MLKAFSICISKNKISVVSCLKFKRKHLWICGLLWENMVKIKSLLPTVLGIGDMDLKVES